MSYIDITDRLTTILTAFVGANSGIEFGFSTAEGQKAVYPFETSKADAYPAACIVPTNTLREPFSKCDRKITYDYSIIIYFERTMEDPRHRDIEETCQRLVDELVEVLDDINLLCDIDVYNTQVIADVWSYLRTPAGRSRTCTLTLQMNKKFKRQ